MNKEIPFFSIVVPIYNVEKYLKQCVESVLKQDFFNIEIILVDDGSPDLCPEICDEFSKKDNRIKVIHKKNSGLSDARNKGLEKAIGEYILFLDSDDYYLDSTFLSKIKKKLEIKKVDIIFHKRRYYIENNNEFKNLPLEYDKKLNDLETTSELFYELSKIDSLEAHACLKVIRREFLIKNNLFFKKGILSEDVEWFFRVAPYVKSARVTNDVTYCYRVRNGSITHSINLKHLDNLMEIILVNSVELLKIKDDKMREALLNYLCYQYYITLGLIWIYGEDKKKEYLNKLFKLSWISKYSISKKTKMPSYLIKYFKYLTPAILGIYIRKK